MHVVYPYYVFVVSDLIMNFHFSLEAQVGKRRGMLSIKMLGADESGARSQGSVLIDKVIIRKPG